MAVETKVITMDCPAAERDSAMEQTCNEMGAQGWTLHLMGEKEPYSGPGGVPRLRRQLIFIRSKNSMLLEG